MLPRDAREASPEKPAQRSQPREASQRRLWFMQSSARCARRAAPMDRAKAVFPTIRTFGGKWTPAGSARAVTKTGARAPPMQPRAKRRIPGGSMRFGNGLTHHSQIHDLAASLFVATTQSWKMSGPTAHRLTEGGRRMQRASPCPCHLRVASSPPSHTQDYMHIGNAGPH